MPMTFTPRERSAIDEDSGLIILRPRILPENGGGRIEYQYTFLKNDERIGGVGLSGTQPIIKRNEKSTWEFKLEITHESELGLLLNLKQKINNNDNNLDFITSIANGLIAVFEKQKDEDFSYQYTVLTTPGALARHEIYIPSKKSSETENMIILAESYIPALAARERRS